MRYCLIIPSSYRSAQSLVYQATDCHITRCLDDFAERYGAEGLIGLSAERVKLLRQFQHNSELVAAYATESMAIVAKLAALDAAEEHCRWRDEAV